MHTLRSFLAGIVDYAGLFPPAQLDMRHAVLNYDEYLHGGDSDLLGRFVVPAARLAEFDEIAAAVLPRARQARPWSISALIGDDLDAGTSAVLDFNSRHAQGSGRGFAFCDSVELHARTVQEVVEAGEKLTGTFRVFLELPLEHNSQPLIAAAALHGASAKIRTGGVTQGSFPTADRVVDFLSTCNRHAVPFKATAGLHHALRASYPLTYDPDSPRGTMFGYLNLFLTAAFLRKGMSPELALELLEESRPEAFGLSNRSITWREWRVDIEELVSTRAEYALSFGSCSFKEPVDEARSLGLI